MSPTREKVIDLLDQGFNVRAIAAALGISTQAVYKHMKAAGIPTARERANQ